MIAYSRKNRSSEWVGRMLCIRGIGAFTCLDLRDGGGTTVDL